LNHDLLDLPDYLDFFNINQENQVNPINQGADKVYLSVFEEKLYCKRKKFCIEFLNLI
jgi:hypothetical protein